MLETKLYRHYDKICKIITLVVITRKDSLLHDRGSFPSVFTLFYNEDVLEYLNKNLIDFQRCYNVSSFFYQNNQMVFSNFQSNKEQKIDYSNYSDIKINFKSYSDNSIMSREKFIKNINNSLSFKAFLNL